MSLKKPGAPSHFQPVPLRPRPSAACALGPVPVNPEVRWQLGPLGAGEEGAEVTHQGRSKAAASAP